ncbi:hypothetical protein GFY24_21955 [Nocardia sp. SYP-A9097]|uniref:hypothetical protein n=1 Tax=Nocardia sp. SYP-A9097 TaxID=2663237 RepID=UPI00129A0BD7|nr:hypothetical protein [Nocardia sp. SYP-A9097]MRH90072.1 hypothetical protein [Nocardia sp. SYP-A9097]
MTASCTTAYRPRGRTATAALLGITALALSACGSHDSAPALPTLGAPVQPKTQDGAPVPDVTALRNNLLDASQLPSGYTSLGDPPTGSTTGAGANTTPPQCAKVLAPIAEQATNAATRAAAQYGGPDFDSIDIDAAAYANGGAAQAFSTVQALLRDCANYSSTDPDGTKVEYQVGGLEQPSSGDASFAFRVHTTSQGLTLYSAVTVTQVGSTVVQFSMSGAREPDSQQLTALTAAQVRKLRGTTGP